MLLDLDEAAVRKRLSRARETLRADLLQRASTAMEHTKLAGGFTAAVMTALPLAADAMGSATTAIAAANGAIKAGMLPRAMTFGGVLGGAAGGVAGVLFGSRNCLRDA